MSSGKPIPGDLPIPEAFLPRSCAFLLSNFIEMECTGGGNTKDESEAVNIGRNILHYDNLSTTSIMTSFTCTSCLNIHRASCKVVASQNNNDHLLGIQNVDANLPINIIMEENEGTVESIPEFVWGEKPSNVFTHDLNLIYKKIVFWRKNIFKLPSGSWQANISLKNARDS